MNEGQFRDALLKNGIELSDKQMNQFERYYETLIDWNEKMNLTGLTERKDVYLKHFYDSISAAFYFDFTKTLNILDVGAGAGFPSIPLKICFPHLEISIVDSLNKRITFLNALASELDLKGVSFYHDRAEVFAKKPEHRETYDLVMARAVARLPVLAELCLPLVKKGGHMVAMKGAEGEEEVKESEKALNLLGGKCKNTHLFQLPTEESKRSIISIYKEKPTPKKYPRKPGTPNKQPLI
ncbi:16S rRNA (guanine(527)-N(7))-methyltransferase RsmG [Bacillus shivajii]|uniref:16S rRNA (guanine(527)-N(7))-methyltransferase RsmG n=1 Tax=Bacillus shivajii TaxID=1983719 RepID=UPI001CFA3252|nr:16S rRNA (guanine(527)-N(7))-methyltransferase RsmG [Bacillus shivajii]UCZ53247.1 16S rRNA (guanine(527)-N(7))-methyltransferase RsmG [Bacillus shivajii]